MSNTILLVDDSEDDTNILIRLLQASHVANPVQTVGTGRQAIAYVGGKGDYADRDKYPEPAILILDLRMPGVSGFEVLEWIESHHNLPRFLIVVLSGLNGLRDVARAYGLGAHTFLAKPCREDDLINLIRAFPDHWEISPRGAIRPDRPKANESPH